MGRPSKTFMGNYEGLPELKQFFARVGTETLSYSYRLNTSYAPSNYRKDLAKISQPLLVVVGQADEAFLPDRFKPAILPFVKADVTLLKGVTHMGAVVGPEVRPVIGKWLERLPQNDEIDVFG